MRIAAFEAPGGQSRLGMVGSDGLDVRDITEQARTDDLVTLIERWSELGPRLVFEGPAHRLDELTLLAPVARPRRNIFCAGKNYRAHVAEFDRSSFGGGLRKEVLPSHPVIFTKPNTTVTGHRRPIDPHVHVTQNLDYEAELAVIIGRKGRGISREQARTYIWGYTIVNDVTARDVQRDHQQWFLGKSLDTFCPMGPYATTADQVDDRDLTIECRVNGERRQHASTAELIFDVPTLIATISAGITLMPGDVIATGTPAGVGVGMNPPCFLQPGDLIECSVSGLGTLVNQVGPGRS